MKDALKKLSEEAKAKILTSFGSESVTNLIAKTKASSEQDSGSFRVVVSTGDMDRQGESVNQTGWDLSYFKSNPVVLWAHDYASLPIGICMSIEVKDGKLIAEGKFAPAEANPFAQQVRKLYELGMVNTTSVGFIPKEFDAQNDSMILKQELLEFSFVPVPANPYALRLEQMKTLDLEMLKTKGVEIVEKKEEIKEEKKGEVSAELQVIETREEKYKKWGEVCDALDAFCTVYFDEMTPVEDFTKLLGEMVTILQGIASTGGAMDDGMKAKIKEFIGEKVSIREKMKGNAELLKGFLDTIITSHFALGGIALATGEKNDIEDVVVPRSKPSSELAEVNTFIEARQLMRIADNSIEKVLRIFNDAAKEHSKNK